MTLKVNKASKKETNTEIQGIHESYNENSSIQ